MNERLEQLLSALRFLTRLPLPEQRGLAPLQDSYWAFPLVGLFLAALLALLLLVLNAIGLPMSLAAAILLFTLIGLTGALHEDGLADTADGFGGGWTAERKLEIMRDSQLGSYGIIALLASVLLRLLCLVELTQSGWQWLIAAWCFVLPWSRAGLVVLRYVSNPPDRKGLAASLGGPDQSQCRLAVLTAVIIAIFSVGLAAAIIALMVSAIAIWAIRELAGAQIGGVSGDVLGAAEQLLQLLALIVLLLVAGGQ